MLAVAVMAVFVRDVPGDGADRFALGFAANMVELVVLWFRTGGTIPTIASRRCRIPLRIWSPPWCSLRGAATDPPVIYWLWAIALLIELVGQLVAYRVGRRRRIKEVPYSQRRRP
jgi:hypothetical protein